jgi:hypothetical protein
MIKQGGNEKVEVYYECILKLANFLQHQANNKLLTIFFQVGLQPYLWITIGGMKRDTLFEHNEAIVTCEESMKNAHGY